MSLIDDTETEGISFIWTIQNYSFCGKNDQALKSPAFVLRTDSSEESWRLLLIPRRRVLQDTIKLYLNRLSTSTSLKKLQFALSIRNIRGRFKKIKNEECKFKSLGSKGCIYVSKLLELIKHDEDAFLDDDTVTFRCRIWNINEESLRPGRCYARTIIGINRSTYVCSPSNILQNHFVNKTNEMQKQPVSPKVPFPKMNILLLKEDTSSDQKVQIEIKLAPANKACFATCKISMLDDRKSVYSETHEHLFENLQISQSWKLLFNPGSKMIEDTRMLFKCELAVSSGVEHSMIEKVELGKLEYCSSGCSVRENEADFRDSWKDDLKRFYSEGKLSDVTIRTPTKDFEVHKAVLCARSSVFCAMFERDMSENRTGVVEMEDVDADTASMMLQFVYTDIVEDLEWGSARKLYYAADKYGITALRRTCSDFLQVNINSSNVCDVLVLADMHQDLQLKSFVQDFILKQTSEVMGSVEWKNLIKDQTHLASEVMYMVCMKK